MNKFSYISTTIPSIKLLLNNKLLTRIINHNIPPYHVKIMPTNKCTLNCYCCTFKNRNKKIEIDYNDLISITKKFIKLGMSAVTISGGGDPLTYKPLKKYIEYLHSKKIKIGLTTNGVLFDKINNSFVDKLTWCRISLNDQHNNIQSIHSVVSKYKIDWSFSYIVTNNTNINKLETIIKFANENNFTHIRMVNDILNNSENAFNYIKNKIKTDTNKIIYQETTVHEKGSLVCLSSLLTPVLTPEKFIVPCCGVTYADDPPTLDWPIKFSMGTDIEDIYKNQKHFNGEKCKKCYQYDRNDMLFSLWKLKSIKHKDFI